MLIKDMKIIDPGIIDSEIERIKKSINEIMNATFSEKESSGKETDRIAYLTDQLTFLYHLRSSLIEMNDFASYAYDSGKDHSQNSVFFDNPKSRFLNSEFVKK